MAFSAHAATDANLKIQEKDEKCALVAIASKKGQSINPKDPALKECEGASQEVCGETKSLLGNTINKGKLSSCGGQKVAMVGYCSASGNSPNLGALNISGIQTWRCSTNGQMWAGPIEQCQANCR